MKRTIATIIGITVVLAGIGARAEEPDTGKTESPFGITLHFENDGTFAKRNNSTDRHYTNGVKATFTHHPSWADELAAKLPFAPGTSGKSDGTLRTAVGYALGQNIYTPDGIEITTLIPSERPYAGWLYGGVYLQRARDNEFDHFEFNLGLIGPSSLAEDVQREIHDFFDAAEPRGWDHQLGDEVAFNATYQRKWRISLLTSDGADAVQLIPQAGITLGTVNRHINIGALVRVGMNFPDDFGPARIEEPASATGVPHNEPGGYFFVRLGGKAVEHDVFLEGSNYRSSHDVRAEPLVGEAQFGIVVYLGRLEFTYSQTFFTRQFETQRGKDSFGALTLAWTGHF